MTNRARGRSIVGWHRHMVFVAATILLSLSACQSLVPRSSMPISAQPTSGSATESCLGIEAGSTGTLSSTIDGLPRQALVHMPSDSEPGDKRPVLLIFHGYRDTALVAEQMTGFSTLADTSGFIAVYPQAAGPPSKWDVKGETDLEFVETILGRLAEDGCADGARVFAVGFSMGGAMATALGCRMADRIAAVASVSGLYGPNWAEPCTATRPVPIIAFHGAVDPQVPYAGGVIDDGREPDLPDVMAVESWASLWAERNGCDPDARLEAMIGEVEPLVWEACVAPVRLYRIQDGGHTWPGSVLAEPMTNRDISASELIWQFLRMSHLPS